MSPEFYIFLMIAFSVLVILSYIGIGALFDYNWTSDMNGWLMLRNIFLWPVMIALFHRHKVMEIIERIRHND